MKLSLWGPHSFERSTLEPTVTEELGPALLPAPFFNRVWYFCHQVGWFGFRVCPKLSSAPINRQMMIDINRRGLAMRFLPRSRGMSYRPGILYRRSLYLLPIVRPIVDSNHVFE